jgi:hypothetical protein
VGPPVCDHRRVSDIGVYQERRGFTPKIIMVLVVAALFVAVAIVVPMGAGLRWTTIVFLGGGGLFVAWSARRRGVALRVDANGITLGGPPLRRASDRFVPWPLVSAVVLWKAQSGLTSTRYLAVVRTDGAPLDGRPLGTMGEVGATVAHTLIIGSDPRLVTNSIHLNDWRLNPTDLVAALRRFAPHVTFVDQTSRTQHR